MTESLWKKKRSEFKEMAGFIKKQQSHTIIRDFKHNKNRFKSI